MSFQEGYRFGPYHLDPAERECRRGDELIPLTGKAFDLLQLFMRDPGRTIPKAKLMEALWPETVVEESNLTQAVFVLRKALGDDSEHAVYVQTVPRLGYKFVSPVTSVGTPQGPQKTLHRGADHWRTWRWIAVGVFVTVAAGAVLWHTKSAAAQPIRSIAVVPLRNLSGDPTQEAYTDGTTEALTSSLARIHSLDVTSQTSMLRYKSGAKSLPEIAKELGGIDFIVEGSVQRSDGRVRISAQLIRGSTDKHLWANEYEGDTSDVLKLQAEVARAIAKEIEAKITPEESRILASARGVNVAAQDEYFMGQYDFTASMPSTLASGARPVTYDGFSQDRLKHANAHFLRATELDPEYAEGYLGQAMVKARSHDMDRALPLAQKALKLDPTLAQSHAVLGNIHYERWEWADADREFRRAIQLDPSSLDASQAYAQFFFATGHFERGVAFGERSLKKQPFSDGMEFQYASNLYGAGRYEDAISHMKRAAQLNPTSLYPRSMLFDVYKTTRRFQDALALAESLDTSFYPSNLILRGRAYALLGRRAEALQILHKVLGAGLSPGELFYIDLGDKERAFDLLNKDLDERYAVARLIKFAPSYADLHSDPRFRKLAARLNMPDLP